MKKYTFLIIAFTAVLLQSCTTTFMGSVFIISFGDIVMYVMLAFLIAGIIALRSSVAKRRRNFWIWFIVSLLLTPLTGFIYLLITFTRRDTN
jgi:uncharacterized membrane protein HdeD (DUF308 family)